MVLNLFPINRKGGVGKTTLSVDIAYLLSKRGYRVLAVDTDIQGTLYETLTGIRTGLFPMPQEYSNTYNTFISNPIKHVEITPEGHFGYGAVDMDAAYFPVELFTVEEYADGFKEKIELCINEYDFVLYDLPPFQDAAKCPILKTQEAFEKIVPLIITSPTETEMDIGMKSYEWFVSAVRAHGFQENKLNPLMILNKYSDCDEKEIRKILDDNEGKLILKSKLLNTNIPVRTIPFQQLYSGAKDKYSFCLVEEPRAPRDIGNMDQGDLVDFWLSSSINDMLAGPGDDEIVQKGKDLQKYEEYRKYLSEIRDLAAGIENIAKNRGAF